MKRNVYDCDLGKKNEKMEWGERGWKVKDGRWRQGMEGEEREGLGKVREGSRDWIVIEIFVFRRM